MDKINQTSFRVSCSIVNILLFGWCILISTDIYVRLFYGIILISILIVLWKYPVFSSTNEQVKYIQNKKLVKKTTTRVKRCLIIFPFIILLFLVGGFLLLSANSMLAFMLFASAGGVLCTLIYLIFFMKKIVKQKNN